MESRFFGLENFGWMDALDILLISFLIYRFLLLIKGTRAVQIALGIVFVVIAYYLSQAFELDTINWLLGNFHTVIVIAIIILFQPEIRRALAQFGKNPLMGFFRSAKQRDTLEEVVLSIITLASKQIGALIVLERETGLRDYIEGGIKLDAIVSYDLILSIFNPRSPLHDGAVIICHDRIASAACFFPLTLNPRLGRELGTRHRAALGLSEETDALVIVVSEETGSISLAVEGKLLTKLDPQTLRNTLLEFLEKEKKESAGEVLSSHEDQAREA